MAWVYLIAAGLLEIVWATAMKKSHGFTLLLPSLVTVVTMAASFALLALAMRSLPLGTAYTIWTGIGAVGAFLVGVAFLGDLMSVQRVIAAGFILVGLVLMKLAPAA
jgi:quaternary ammonium compound-resistance protein SugE